MEPVIVSGLIVWELDCFALTPTDDGHDSMAVRTDTALGCALETRHEFDLQKLRCVARKSIDRSLGACSWAPALWVARAARHACRASIPAASRHPRRWPPADACHFVGALPWLAEALMRHCLNRRCKDHMFRRQQQHGAIVGQRPNRQGAASRACPKSEGHQATPVTSPSWPCSTYGAAAGLSTCGAKVAVSKDSASGHPAAA